MGSHVSRLGTRLRNSCKITTTMKISENEIDRINELHRGIRRAAGRMLRDAFEIGDFFCTAHKEKGVHRGGKPNSTGGNWGSWLNENFPDIGAASVYRYMNIARHRNLLEPFSRSENDLGLNEAERVIRFHERAAKKNAQPKA